MLNGIWLWQKDMTVTNLQKIRDRGIYDLFLHVGYPNPSFDPRLKGIVPETQYPISVDEAKTKEYIRLLDSVDLRLRLWAWFGTYAPGGHAAAKVDLSTPEKRALIIENIAKVANYGFYGVQDDTEDVLGDLSQKYRGQTDFWNEEQIILSDLGKKLAVFKYAGPPSLWAANKYIPQMNVDFIIAVPDLKATEEILDHYGGIKNIWISEIQNVFELTNCKVLVNLQYQYGSDYPSFPEKLNWLTQSGVEYQGHTFYAFGYYTDEDWAIWKNYQGIPDVPIPEPEPEPEPPSKTVAARIVTNTIALGCMRAIRNTFIPGSIHQRLHPLI